VIRGSNLSPFIGKHCLLLSISDDKSCYTLSFTRLTKVNTYPETSEIELIFDNHSLNHFPGNGWKDVIFALPTPRELARRVPIVKDFC
jgi:hypothetical protein